MEKVKFDELDRECVVEKVQEHYDVKLDKVGQRPKWRRDESGRNWWVLGGVGDWNGIPKEMMEDEKQAQLEGKLVIADKKLTSIEVFVGPLSQLVSSRNKLPPTKETGAYNFNVKVSGDRMRCVEVPAVVLERIASIPYSDEDRERQRSTDKNSKILASLTPEQLKELLDKHGSNEAELT